MWLYALMSHKGIFPVSLSRGHRCLALSPNLMLWFLVSVSMGLGNEDGSQAGIILHM